MPTTPNLALRYPDLTVAPNVPADIQNLATDVDTPNGAWTAWTPTVTGWTTVTTTLTGWAYQKFGKTVRFRGQLALATVTTLGSATINMTLPFTAAAGMPTQNQAGTCLYRSNAGAYVAGVVRVLASATTMQMLHPQPGGATPNIGLVTGAYPSPQVAGDIWTVTGCYETT